MELTNIRKAAVLLKTLDPAVSMDVLKYLDDKTIEQVSTEMASLDAIPEDVKQAVTAEFYGAVPDFGPPPVFSMPPMPGLDAGAPAMGGMTSLGSAEPPAPSLSEMTVDNLKKVGQEKLYEMLKDEHPTAVGLIISSLEAPAAALLLSSFPQETQIELVGIMASDMAVAPGVKEDILRAFIPKVLAASKEEGSASKGKKTEATAEILSYINTEKSKAILEGLKAKDEQMGEGIKEQIITFENVFKKIDGDKAVQRALKNIDRKDLVMALRKAPEDTKEIIFRNMSTTAVDMLKEDMDAMGPQKVPLIEEAQRKIVSVIRGLVTEGVIAFATAKGDTKEELI